MKKITAVLLLLVIFVATSNAQRGDKKFAITIKNGKLSLNNSILSDNWLMAPAIKVLGTGSRQRDGYNKTHSYDNYGIVLFEPKDNGSPSGKLAEFQVYFSALEDEKSNVATTGFYTGSCSVGSLKLQKDITADRVREYLVNMGYTESDSYSAHNFRFAKDGLYIYFLFDEIEQRLIKMSIGKDMRKNDE